jgi:hypothetical protein
MGQRPLLLIMESGFPNHAVNARRRKRTRPCVVAMAAFESCGNFLRRALESSEMKMGCFIDRPTAWSAGTALTLLGRSRGA